MSKRNEIRREEKCLDYAGGQVNLRQPEKIQSVACHSMQGNQMWFYQDQMIRHASGYCMELSSNNDHDIYMAMCEPSNPNQKWSWKKRMQNATTNIHF